MPKKKTTGKITHFHGGANKDGGHVSAGGKITHHITPNTDVHVSGQASRFQSFNGHGGQTHYGGGIGITHRF